MINLSPFHDVVKEDGSVYEALLQRSFENGIRTLTRLIANAGDNSTATDIFTCLSKELTAHLNPLIRVAAISIASELVLYIPVGLCMILLLL